MPRRNKFNLSHTRLASLDLGQLVPVGLVEVLPGDTFRHSSSVLLRIAATANPLMHEVQARLHHWYVPHRIAYDMGYQNGWYANTWEDFWKSSTGNAETLDSGQDIDAADVTAGSLANHLGLPVASTDNSLYNWLPFLAYQMVFDEYYRDTDHQTSVFDESLAESDLLTLRRICWEKDYFTTCRTDPQAGSAVSIPFEAGLKAPVLGLGATNTVTWDITSGTMRQTGGVDVTAANTDGNRWRSLQTANIGIRQGPDAALGGDTQDVAVYADLAAATGGGIDVNEFRRAMALQKFLEARNMYGDRYRDYLGYLGIRSSDGRYGRPEYLGGGKQRVAFSEVLTTADTMTSEVGDMSGHGIAAMRTRPYTKFFEENGYVLSLLSIRPKAMYQQMVPRHFFRSTRDDFWQKEYELFGPQAVLSREVYGLSADQTTVFGYQDRHREYREQPSQVSGLFGSTLDDWHLAREFGSTPTLDTSFVTCTPTDRVYNDNTQPEAYVQVAHRISARRLVSAYPRAM